MAEDPPSSSAAPSPGCLMPGIWLVLAALGTLGAAAAVGLSAMDSETAGIHATYAVALPLGFLWSGALGGLAVHLTRKTSPGLRAGAPLGCGCLGGVVLMGATVAFFALLWPAL